MGVREGPTEGVFKSQFESGMNSNQFSALKTDSGSPRLLAPNQGRNGGSGS